MVTRIIQSLFVLLSLLIVLVACGPMLLSIYPVNQYALSWVNAQIPQKLQAESIHASWFNGITIQGLAIKDHQGKPLAHFDTLHTTVDLVSLIKEHKIEATIQAKSPELAPLGNTLKASVRCDVANSTTGPFAVHIQSPLFTGETSCLITDDSLTLEKPLTAQYTLLAEMGARSTKPIELTVDPDGFFIPLKDFALDKVRIKDIKIDPGVLYCKNNGIMAALLTLFNAKLTNEISLWSTPLYAELKDGIVVCKRFDMLISGSFPIASWGKIHLVDDKIDMTLGITGVSLVQAFALGKIDPTYMIQLPIRGTLESPRIDTAAATSKIAAMRVMQSRLAFTNPIGALFSVGAMVFDKVDAPPPPTTTPFPWKLK